MTLYLARDNDLYLHTPQWPKLGINLSVYPFVGLEVIVVFVANPHAPDVLCG